MKINQKGFGALEGILVIIIAGLIGAVAFYVMDANKNADQSLTNAESSSDVGTKVVKKPMSATNDAYAGWQTYDSKDYSIKYPEGWKVYAKGQQMPIGGRTDGTSSTTATDDYFQDPKDGIGAISFDVSVDNSKLTADAYMKQLFPNGEPAQGEVSAKSNFKVSQYTASKYTLSYLGSKSYETAVVNGSKVIFFTCTSSKADVVDKAILTLKIK